MATINITLIIKRAWWVMPYLNGVVLLSRLTGMEPDIDKVTATAIRGYKLIIK